MKKVLELPSREIREYRPGLDTTMFDLSANGTRIAYAACDLSEETVPGDDGDMRVYNYEIFASDFDGSNAERLTKNTHFDVLPAWSPDGESLAFISDPDRSIFGGGFNLTGRGPRVIYEAAPRITIHEVATGESREIGLPAGYAAAPIRLEWSPSGDRIAFIVLEGERHPWNLAVYTVGVDGTGLTRVSEAVSGAAWSPDGDSIAMIVPEGDDGRALYIFATDGSNLVKEKHRGRSSKLGNPSGTDLSSGLWLGNLSWSPDGSAILVENTYGTGSVIPLGAVAADTGVPLAFDSRSRAKTPRAGAGSILASPLNDWLNYYSYSAWSPDGTHIAVRRDNTESFELEVVDLEGNSRVLLEWEREYR